MNCHNVELEPEPEHWWGWQVPHSYFTKDPPICEDEQLLEETLSEAADQLRSEMNNNQTEYFLTRAERYNELQFAIIELIVQSPLNDTKFLNDVGIFDHRGINFAPTGMLGAANLLKGGKFWPPREFIRVYFKQGLRVFVPWKTALLEEYTNWKQDHPQETHQKFLSDQGFGCYVYMGPCHLNIIWLNTTELKQNEGEVDG